MSVWKQTAALLGVGTVFGLILGIIFTRSGMHWWYGLVGFWPPLGAGILYWMLKSIAERTWGVVAFTEVSDERVAAVLLAHGRCPSCSFPLAEAAGSAEYRTCSECGAGWRSMPVPA